MLHFGPAALLLFALGLQGLQSAEASWCHAPAGSCVGERRSFVNKSFLTGLDVHVPRPTDEDLLRFADWDGDGDTDILVGTYGPRKNRTFRILFHERLSNDTFHVHELIKIPDIYQIRFGFGFIPTISFQVADWDGDEQLDLLVCTRVLAAPGNGNVSYLSSDDVQVLASWVTFLSHGLLPLNSLQNGTVILNRGEADQIEPFCDMKPVDWDEDGDLDLFLDDKYFERRSANLSDLVERTHPLGKYNGTVLQIVDFDGDGHSELIVDTLPKRNSHAYRALASLRRALDGSFVQFAENPFTDVIVLPSQDFYVLDWNSDGLPDILAVDSDLSLFPHTRKSSRSPVYIDLSPNGYTYTGILRYYEQVQNFDIVLDFHLNVFEHIEHEVPSTRYDSLPLSLLSYPRVVDWNQDGVDDHVLVSSLYHDYHYDGNVRVYEMRGLDVREVPKESMGFDGLEYCCGTSPGGEQHAIFVDWDGDGDLDLITSKGDRRLHYFERVSGHFKAEQPGNPFRTIRKKPRYPFSTQTPLDEAAFTPVDWDQDGDMDLVLGDGRYYEQLANGSLKLWEQNIFTPVLGSTEGQCLEGLVCALRFLDCDGDGDLDLLRVEGSRDPPLQVCEHNSAAGTLTCGHDFLCLGTNLRNFRPSQVDAFQKFGELISLDLVNVSDGRLKFIAFHRHRFQAVLWTAGFCTPEGACHGKGFCEKKHLQCTCGPGHELGDCSRCQRGFHGVLEKLGQIRNCKACPAKNGKLCDGRGDCFDDAAAQALAARAAPAQQSTEAFMATGNGSCRCYEAHFNGSDVDGRSTCTGGICPAGSEEQDGTCRPCEEGSFSLAGGPCTKCGSGSYSLAASSSCLECEPGKVSEISGASKCDACPAGKYEIDRKSCSDCQAGFISSSGNFSCEKCPAGRVAPTTGSSTCALCPGGTFAPPGRSVCQKCLRGTYSLGGSGSCLPCLAGTVSMVDGASRCDFCPPGREGLNGQSCSPCRSGFMSPGGNSPCTKCPAGFKAPKTGSSACEPCPEGFHSEEGAPSCIPCPPGTIYILSGTGSRCRPCDAGSFAKGSACEPCPSGTFASSGSSECKKCGRGTYSSTGSGSCVRCLPGTVSIEEGASACDLCPPGTEEFYRQSCRACSSGLISLGGNSSCKKCPAGFNAPKTGSSACEPCPGGSYSEEGAPTCIPCPVGTISVAASGRCDSCEGNFLRAVPDATKQSCEVDSIQVLLLAGSALASTGFFFLCLTGFLGKATIADVSAQGQKVVVTTTLSHFLLKRSQVTFTGTGNPNLEGQSWTVHALNSFQLTLHVEGGDLDHLDTSMGRFRIKCPGAFLHTGLWRCPLIFWCLLFGAASASAMSQLTWSLSLLMGGLGFFAGSLAFAWRLRQGQRTPLSKRRRQFLKEWPLPRQPCERGPDRSMTAGQLQDFVQFFEAFIKERSMHYVCSNIVKPLTEPYQLSFVELVGPTAMEWFVSHCWGMAVRHFNDAIRKHAMSYASEWRGLGYWICTFSNSQWKVEDELGKGVWQESSFYLALRSPSCKGTAMVIDEQVLPLQRIWCLFEVYHTILLSQNDHFQGLLLCASTGVLQEGRAGTDVAVRVAQRARDLDTRSAGASNEADLQMIHALIKEMPGGFDAMNDFVRETICRALEASHDHYEQTFRGLIGELTSRVASARGDASFEPPQNHSFGPPLSPAGAPLPTLLPRQTMPSLGQRADFVSLKGQENPTEDVYPLP